MRAGHGLFRITHDGHPVPGLGEQLGIGVKTFRAGNAQLEVELQRRFYIAVAHVVAVADPGHGLALDRAAMLEEGLHVGQQLAGVQVIGQAVYHRYTGVGGEFGQGAVGKGADHHRVEHARHDDGAVADRLAAAQLGIARGQENRLAAELDHAGFERQPGPGRGFLEDHPQYAVFQGFEQYAAVTQVLQLDASTDHTEQFVGCEIHQGEKVPSAHV
ncbi:hypothetical protein D3C78_1256770 [compost metagenome]